jgi:hypothetical protein
MNRFRVFLRCTVTAFAIAGTCLAQSSTTNDAPEAEVLTRGPVHEAFAGVISFNPEPGIVVPKAPPAPIEEVPPDVKPEGENVAWVPGYWAWDDERNDFIWVSGVWRALPPGRQWVPGYWVKTGDGYQWISGYWSDARTTEVAYLPPPPPTIEAGPNIAAPSPDYIWVPGCWVWYEGRYAWRPGYWLAARPDWDWCPPYYIWTPRGYVFVEGYWDYCLERRGVLFAPVYFGPGVFVRTGYFYSPTIVISLSFFPDHLFFRPRYHHCYFGDYYAVRYYRSGYYASFTFQSRRYGYDPIYSRRRWEHRHDRDWERQVINNYRYRRDHPDARPPRTWAAQKNMIAAGKTKDRSLAVAAPISELSQRPDSPVQFQPVAKQEKQQMIQREQEVRKVREERRTLESAPAIPAPAAKPGKRQIQPSTANLPQSPILSQTSERLERDRSPSSPRPTPRQAPILVPQRQAPGPDSNGNRGNHPADQPRPQFGDKPGRREPPPQAQPPSQRPAQDAPRDSNRGEGRGDRRGGQGRDDDSP